MTSGQAVAHPGLGVSVTISCIVNLAGRDPLATAATMALEPRSRKVHFAPD